METIEHKNGQICDDYDYSCKKEHEMSDNYYNIYGSLEKNGRDKVYIWFYNTTNGTKDIMESNNIVYFSGTGCKRGVIKIKMKMNMEKYLLK